MAFSDHKNKFCFVGIFLLTFLSFFSLNIYFILFEVKALIFVFLMFLFLLAYLLYKTKKFLYLGISLIILLIYSIFYSYVNIYSYEEYDFIERNELKMDYTDFESKTSPCIENQDCDLQNAVNEDVILINEISQNPKSTLAIFKLNSLTYGIYSNKDFLQEEGITFNNIDFDKNIFFQEFLSKSYNNTLHFNSKINYNLFYSHNQFATYLKNYYYFIYDSFVNNDYEKLENNKYSLNINLLFLNRKYFYDTMLYPSDSYIKKFEDLNKIESYINELNQ